MNRTTRFILVLGVICLVGAFGVTGVYLVVRENIATREAEVQAKALKVVLPTADRIERIPEESNNPASSPVFVGTNQGEVVGYAAEGEAQGYSGKIRVLVGLGPGENPGVLAVEILAHTETPGLGAKISEVHEVSDGQRVTFWKFLSRIFNRKEKFKTTEEAEFLDQFRGKPFNQLEVTRSKEKGKINAITGATISSKAVTAAVRDACQRIEKAVAQTKSVGVAHSPGGS